MRFPILRSASCRSALCALVAGLTLALVTVHPVAVAQQDPGFRNGRQGERQGGGQGERRGPERRMPDNVQRAPANDPQFQRPGQMSPDERRALRRDIHDVGRDVYRRPGPP